MVLVIVINALTQTHSNNGCSIRYLIFYFKQGWIFIGYILQVCILNVIGGFCHHDLKLKITLEHAWYTCMHLLMGLFSPYTGKRTSCTWLTHIDASILELVMPVHVVKITTIVLSDTSPHPI